MRTPFLLKGVRTLIIFPEILNKFPHYCPYSAVIIELEAKRVFFYQQHF